MLLWSLCFQRSNSATINLNLTAPRRRTSTFHRDVVFVSVRVGFDGTKAISTFRKSFKPDTLPRSGDD